MANSEDPGEMTHQGMHCLLERRFFRENDIFLEEIITCNPSIHTIEHPNGTVSNFMKY